MRGGKHINTKTETFALEEMTTRSLTAVVAAKVTLSVRRPRSALHIETYFRGTLATIYIRRQLHDGPLPFALLHDDSRKSPALLYVLRSMYDRRQTTRLYIWKVIFLRLLRLLPSAVGAGCTSHGFDEASRVAGVSLHTVAPARRVFDSIGGIIIYDCCCFDLFVVSSTLIINTNLVRCYSCRLKTPNFLLDFVEPRQPTLRIYKMRTCK